MTSYTPETEFNSSMFYQVGDVSKVPSVTYTNNSSYGITYTDNTVPVTINMSTGGDTSQWDYWVEPYPWYQPIVKEYYPVYYDWYSSSSNKHKQAFDVAKMLVKKKLVDPKKIKDFIELVESIYKEL